MKYWHCMYLASHIADTQFMSQFIPQCLWNLPIGIPEAKCGLGTAGPRRSLPNPCGSARHSLGLTGPHGRSARPSSESVSPPDSLPHHQWIIIELSERQTIRSRQIRTGWTGIYNRMWVLTPSSPEYPMYVWRAAWVLLVLSLRVRTSGDWLIDWIEFKVPGAR